jgi:small subunit ribosomal protein S12e
MMVDGDHPEEVEVAADASKAGMTVEDALRDVLKRALVHDGLARGLRECAKALDRYFPLSIQIVPPAIPWLSFFHGLLTLSRQAHLAVLAESCDSEPYNKLIEALCAEHNINLIKIADGKKLGEWAGLCVVDREGNARKVVGASCVVVKDYGEESEALSVLLDYFKTR